MAENVKDTLCAAIGILIIISWVMVPNSIINAICMGVGFLLMYFVYGF